MDRDRDLPSVSTCVGELRMALNRLRQALGGKSPLLQVHSEKVASMRAMLSTLQNAAKNPGWVHPAMANDFQRGLTALQELESLQNAQRDGALDVNEQELEPPRAYRHNAVGSRSVGSSAFGGQASSSAVSDSLLAAQHALGLLVVHYCESLSNNLENLKARLQQTEPALAETVKSRSQILEEKTKLEAKVVELEKELAIHREALQQYALTEVDMYAKYGQADDDGMPIYWDPAYADGGMDMLGDYTGADSDGEETMTYHQHTDQPAQQGQGQTETGDTVVSAEGLLEPKEATNPDASAGSSESMGWEMAPGTTDIPPLVETSSPTKAAKSPRNRGEPYASHPTAMASAKQPVPFLKSRSGWARGSAQSGLPPLALGGLRSGSTREVGSLTARPATQADLEPAPAAVDASGKLVSAAHLLQQYRKWASSARFPVTSSQHMFSAPNTSRFGELYGKTTGAATASLNRNHVSYPQLPAAGSPTAAAGGDVQSTLSSSDPGHFDRPDNVENGQQIAGAEQPPNNATETASAKAEDTAVTENEQRDMQVPEIKTEAAEVVGLEAVSDSPRVLSQQITLKAGIGLWPNNNPDRISESIPNGSADVRGEIMDYGSEAASTSAGIAGERMLVNVMSTDDSVDRVGAGRSDGQNNADTITLAPTTGGGSMTAGPIRQAHALQPGPGLHSLVHKPAINNSRPANNGPNPVMQACYELFSGFSQVMKGYWSVIKAAWRLTVATWTLPFWLFASRSSSA